LLRDVNPIHAADELEGGNKYSKQSGLGYQGNTGVEKTGNEKVKNFLKKKMDARFKNKPRDN
jgi:hypothetical protein